MLLYTDSMKGHTHLCCTAFSELMRSCKALRSLLIAAWAMPGRCGLCASLVVADLNISCWC